MIKSFLNWNKKNKDVLEHVGITIDYISNLKEENNDSIAIDYLTKRCIGRVSVWATGYIDVEILDIDSERSLLYEHYECDNQMDYGKLLSHFFQILTANSTCKNENPH